MFPCILGHLFAIENVHGCEWWIGEEQRNQNRCENINDMIRIKGITYQYVQTARQASF
jgi:hypothetical protein